MLNGLFLDRVTFDTFSCNYQLVILNTCMTPEAQNSKGKTSFSAIEAIAQMKRK